MTEKELEDIHNKMETLLGLKGAYIDGLYVCPHHPDKGYEGEVAALKIDCPCRKPKPGMLLRAARDFNICLADSWMAGDQENDVRAGKNAGCRTVLIAGRETSGRICARPPSWSLPGGCRRGFKLPGCCRRGFKLSAAAAGASNTL